MTTAGVLTEAQFQKWLADAFKEGNNWRTEIRKYCGDNKYMRGIKPKKIRRYPMFHTRKDLIEKIEQLTKRVDEFESRMGKLREAVFWEYQFSSGFFDTDHREISASEAVEKICEHLHLEFKCEPAKEKECHLVSTLPVRKPKKKAKKKK